MDNGSKLYFLDKTVTILKMSLTIRILHEYKEKKEVAIKVTDGEEINRLHGSLRLGEGGMQRYMDQSVRGWSMAVVTGERVAIKDGTDSTNLKLGDSRGGWIRSELRNISNLLLKVMDEKAFSTCGKHKKEHCHFYIEVRWWSDYSRLKWKVQNNELCKRSEEQLKMTWKS